MLTSEIRVRASTAKSDSSLERKGSGAVYHSGIACDVSKEIQGCPFAPRYESAQEKCVTSTIALKEVAPGHSSACLRIQLGEIDLAPAFAGRNF
jgi:hypothetical protein